ncbi:MAG: esterase-like activity of phytase family protein [Candidatus Cloacimonetes bacterium]|nr:esterase-like activity of phytase family protein [Candidatus Cloacimonadota bacterium]
MKISILIVFLIISGSIAADVFPGLQPGMEIGGFLPAGYEPSGAVWHNRLQKLFLVNDNGMVSKMDSDGSNVINWNVSGDLEGICIVDKTSDFVYIGVENPDNISEFNIETGTVTRSFDLTPWMTGPSNQGLEALTFVPDSTNAEGGLFFAGLQSNGTIYVFELPITTSSTDTSVTFVT